MKQDNWDLVEAVNDLPITCDVTSLTYLELRLLKLMLDPEFIQLTVAEKCEFAKCSKDSWYRALKKPAFIEAMNQLAMTIIKENSVKLVQATVKYALAGSYPHMKMALEAGGIIQPQTNEGGEITIRFADPRAKQVIDITNE